MKPYLLITFFLAFFVSCQKEINKSDNSSLYLNNLKIALRDSLSANDYAGLDLDKAIATKSGNSNVQLLRIPYSGKLIQNDFVLLQTNSEGNILKGRIVHIEKSEDPVNSFCFNGTVSIATLDRKTVIESGIQNGFIQAFHSAYKADKLQPDIPVLPEVIVVGYIHAGGGISLSDWICLSGLFNSGHSEWEGTYSPLTGAGGGGDGGGNGGSGGSSGGGTGGGGSVSNGQTIQVDFENQYNNPAIDIQKYVNCYNAIPDAGAKCTMTIFTDIPVNGDPTKFFDWANGSPGHTFIQFQKQNGGQLVSQNIGFYPKTGWKTALTPAPLDGKFADNQGHEMNASLQLAITPAQLRTGLTQMLYLARFVKYDIDDYNCTDWALQVFNEVAPASQYLDIPRYNIPGGMAPNGTSTPNGLYIKLQQMKQADPLNKGIQIPLIGWVGASKGPCN